MPTTTPSSGTKTEVARKKRRWKSTTHARNRRRAAQNCLDEVTRPSCACLRAHDRRRRVGSIAIAFAFAGSKDRRQQFGLPGEREDPRTVCLRRGQREPAAVI